MKHDTQIDKIEDKLVATEDAFSDAFSELERIGDNADDIRDNKTAIRNNKTAIALGADAEHLAIIVGGIITASVVLSIIASVIAANYYVKKYNLKLPQPSLKKFKLP